MLSSLFSFQGLIRTPGDSPPLESFAGVNHLGVHPIDECSRPSLAIQQMTDFLKPMKVTSSRTRRVGRLVKSGWDVLPPGFSYRFT